MSRPPCFEDAGVYLLRTPPREGPEIWCRCDGGPHGFLSIAAHAHADALAVEVRHGGVEVLVDPGTYCYHGEPAWRAYFRSTIGHNTLELGGEDQSVTGGPFLWTSHATTRVLDTVEGAAGELASWSAQHDGYARLEPPAVHRRTVTLDAAARSLTIVDEVQPQALEAGPGTPGGHRCRLAFHLGPTVTAVLRGSTADLSWPGLGQDHGRARLCLPEELVWSAHRGETNPPMGWYSSGFGRKVPTVTLVGTGSCELGGVALEATLQLDEGSFG